MVIIHSLTQYVWLEMRHKCHTRMAQFWQNSPNVLSVKSAHWSSSSNATLISGGYIGLLGSLIRRPQWYTSKYPVLYLWSRYRISPWYEFFNKIFDSFNVYEILRKDKTLDWHTMARILFNRAPRGSWLLGETYKSNSLNLKDSGEYDKNSRIWKTTSSWISRFHGQKKARLGITLTNLYHHFQPAFCLEYTHRL